MSNHRDDIPDLPRGWFWFEYRAPSVWRRDGAPCMTIRKRTLFGSKQIAQQFMHSLDYESDEQERNIIREETMRALGRKLGYE